MRYIFLILAVCVMLLPACKKMQENTADRLLEKAIEKQTGANASVDIANRSVKIKAKEGQLTFTAGEGKLPINFPADIFIDKDYKIQMNLQAEKGLSLVLESAKDLKTNMTLYKIKMKENGWSLSDESSVSGIGSITFKKKGRAVNMMFFGRDNKTEMNLMVQSNT